MNYQYIRSINSNLEEISQTMVEILKIMSIYTEDKNRLFDLRLILSELLINGYEHGNTSDKNKKIHLSLEYKDKKWHLTVEDEGKGFDYACPKPIDLESCCGRGLLLVNKLSESLIVDKNIIRAIVKG